MSARVGMGKLYGKEPWLTGGGGPTVSVLSATTLAGVPVLVVMFILFLSIQSLSFSAPSSADASCGGPHVGPATGTDFFKLRQKMYALATKSLESKGPKYSPDTVALAKLLKKKKSSGSLVPIIEPLSQPSRKTVLRLDTKESQRIGRTIKEILSGAFDETALWFEDPETYHVTLRIHLRSDAYSVAHSHIEQLVEERQVVEGLANQTCGMKLSLDHVSILPKGQLVGMWQAVDGSEPALLRKDLQKKLELDAETKARQKLILSTTFAHILDYPTLPDEDGAKVKGQMKRKAALQRLLKQLNKSLCRVQASVNELWLVEEKDNEALSLGGRVKTRPFLMRCK